MQKGAAHILAILVAIIVLAGIAFVGHSIISKQSTLQPTETIHQETGNGGNQEDSSDKFIVANPVDLTHIESISKFRSCYGHDYSGKNVDGEEEGISSMKHYYRSTLDVSPSTDKVAVRAPYNGAIMRVSESGSGPNDIQFRFANENGWQMVFFHIASNPNIKQGAQFEAGEVIGYANLNTNTGPFPTFDISLERIKMSPEVFRAFQENPQEAQKKFVTLASPFNYMTNELLAEYEEKGITPENIIVTKEDRDADPCPTAATSRGPNVDFAPTTGNFVELD